MLEVRGLRAGYGSVEILRGIDIDVRAGEIVAVLGSNGVGKSTLNNNISGLYKPFAGSIRFKGEELVGLSSTEIVKRGLIHVPEGRRIFPNMNVRENLELGSLVRGKANRAHNLERVVAIEIPLADNATSAAAAEYHGPIECPSCEFDMLPPGPLWLVAPPMTVKVERGVVTCVADRFGGDCVNPQE